MTLREAQTACNVMLNKAGIQQYVTPVFCANYLSVGYGGSTSFVGTPEQVLEYCEGLVRDCVRR